MFFLFIWFLYQENVNYITMLVYVCVCVTLDNMPMKTALFIRFTLIAWRSNRDFI